MAQLMGDPARPLPSRTQLRTIQAQLEAEVGPLRTLDPARTRASELIDVHAAALALVSPSVGEHLDDPLAEGLSALALAQLDAFPGNLFWDFDLIAAVIVREAGELAEADGLAAAVDCVGDRFERMAALQHLYGRRTLINFSYVHDFTYGFDWAKWLAREPSLHGDPAEPFSLRLGPFSLTFLRYMDQRGHELLALIADNDDKYPQLDGDEARNPFPFSREAEAEIRLHRELARRDLIPVPAWSSDPRVCDWTTRWRIPFADHRVDVAARG
jgi:hypothetical protein